MSSGKWRQFCLGLNELNKLQGMTHHTDTTAARTTTLSRISTRKIQTFSDDSLITIKP